MSTRFSTQPPAQRRRPLLGLERLDVTELHFADELAPGRMIDLPGRGCAFVREAVGPADAPTVLLLHGLLATADLNWSLAIPALAQRFNVVAPNLRGHGRGEQMGRFSCEECAGDIAALVRTLDLGRVVVVGYSLGGLIAQVLVRRNPELVAGVVFCATASQFEVPAIARLLQPLERAARRLPESLRRTALLSVLRPKSADSPQGRWLMQEVRQHDTKALLDAIAEVVRFDSTSWLGQSACRSAVIVMRDDTLVPADAQRELAKVLGRSSVYEIPGDHFACIKRPDQFNEALVAACSGVMS